MIMKNIWYLLLLIVMVSCGKGTDMGNFSLNGNYNINLPPNGTIAASFVKDRRYFHLATGALFIHSYDANSPYGLMSISASSGGISLGLQLNKLLQPGLYRFGKGHGQNQEISLDCNFSNSRFQQDTSTLTGSLIIDSLSYSYLKGRFSITCYNSDRDSLVIRDGAFEGKFDW